MGGLLAQLLPLALLGALAPMPILISLSLLISQGGLAKAIAFDAALAGVFAVIGTVSLVSSGKHTGASDEGSAVTGTIVAVLGVLFIVIAVKQWLRVPDPDAPPPKFMTHLDTMSVARAAISGVILGLINVKQLGIFVGGVAQIVHADVSTAQQWVAMMLFLTAFQVGHRPGRPVHQQSGAGHARVSAGSVMACRPQSRAGHRARTGHRVVVHRHGRRADHLTWAPGRWPVSKEKTRGPTGAARTCGIRPNHRKPDTMRMSRTAPSSSAASASWYGGLL